MQIPFSPPDMTEAEEIEVAQVLRSGWITTGPRTKEFERQIASYCHTPKVVCLELCHSLYGNDSAGTGCRARR